jgi:hypothetical protein
MPSSQGERSGHLFEPRGKVEQTGMYQAVHQPAHREAQIVMLKRGEKFPACAKCEHTVFLLLLAAVHISEDPDLGGKRPH